MRQEHSSSSIQQAAHRRWAPTWACPACSSSRRRRRSHTLPRRQGKPGGQQHDPPAGQVTRLPACRLHSHQPASSPRCQLACRPASPSARPSPPARQPNDQAAGRPAQMPSGQPRGPRPRHLREGPELVRVLRAWAESPIPKVAFSGGRHPGADECDGKVLDNRSQLIC